MGKRRLNSWRWWLQAVSALLLIAVPFAPLPGTLRGILLPVGLGGMLVYLATDSPASRKELFRSLVLFAAFLLLAVLFSLGPGLVVLGILFIGFAPVIWSVIEREHAEYRAERERSRRLPESS